MSKRAPRLTLHSELFTAASSSEEYSYHFVGKGKLYEASISSTNGRPCKAFVYLRQWKTQHHAMQLQTIRNPSEARFVAGEAIPIDDNYEIFCTVWGIPTGETVQLRVMVLYD